MGALCSIIPTLCMGACVEKCCCCCISKEVPWNSSQLTPKFFTDILRAKGVIGANSRVASVDLKVFGVGVGLLSLMYRATLTYAAAEASNPMSSISAKVGDDAAKAPKTLIVKMTPPELQARIVGQLLDLFEAEVIFFERGIAEKADLNAPICYFAATTGYGRYLLILEDLAPAECGDQLVGATIDEATATVRELSALHSKYRGRTRTSPDTKDWILKADDTRYYTLACDSFAKDLKKIDGNLRKLGAAPDLLKAYHREVHQACLWDMRNIFNQRGAQHAEEALGGCSKDSVSRYTLVHGDARMENYFYTAGPKQDETRVIDFQLVKEFMGEADLHYFVSTSMDTDTRRKYEKDLIRLYLKEAQKAADDNDNNAGYSMAEVLGAYMNGVVTTSCIICIGTGSSSTDSPRAKNLWKTIHKRMGAWMEDWQILDFLRKRREDLWNPTTKRLRRFTLEELRAVVPKAYNDLFDDVEVGRIGTSSSTSSKSSGASRSK